MVATCPLPYPDKFQAGAKFWKLHPPGAKTLAQENQLLLYALNQQATVGPNTTPKPWGWDVVASTKWQGWSSLGKMSAMEAMRLFVKTLDEEQPDWWALLEQVEAAAAAAGVEANAMPAAPRSLADRAVLGVWTQLEPAAAAGEAAPRKPLPRYEAAAAVLGGQLYVLGGNYGGRYLSDAWALDLATAAWSQLQLTAGHEAAAEAEGEQPQPQAASPALPPTAGHSVTAYGGKLYVLGGHTKAKGPVSVALRVVDPVARTVAAVETQGTAPSARGGHSAVLIGSQLWVFGGEDAGRRALADLHVLDMDTLTWSTPQVKGKAPLPRSACCATAYLDRYMVVFGGGSVASCFNDVHVFDTQELTWSQPAQAGAKVTPRAGHTGVALGDVWYIVGGGNNVKGCADLLAADLSGLAAGSLTWHVVASCALREPLSSEGICLAALPDSRVLAAFGGYNGKYQNVVSLFRAPEGSAALLAGPAAAAATAVEAAKEKEAPAAPAAAAAVAPPPAANGAAATAPGKAAAAVAAPPPAKPAQASAEQAAAAAAATSAKLVSDLRSQVAELQGALEGARRDAESAIREAAAAKDGAAHELALLRKQLSAAQGAVAEANKSLDESRAALAAEQAKVLKLEAQSAELQAKMGQLSELERELEKYRRAAREEAEKAEKAKKGGGLWGFIAGGSS